VKENVTIITVNFKTPTLLQDCVTSVLSNYPGVPYILIDNGGCDVSLALVRKYARKPNFTTIENTTNRFHGPALNQGVQIATTPYIFTLDSDTKVIKSGFLELMLAEFESDPDLFAIGWLRYTNAQGVASPKQHLKRGMEYIHPYACLMDAAKLRTLPSFLPSGSPATRMMAAASMKGYHLKSFPIEKYVWHKIAGTRGIFEGRYRPPTDSKPVKWRKHKI